MINAFPGYEYVGGKNMYRGEDVGRGGYVYAQPGIYYNVVCFDSQSHHPSSTIAMNCFGEYTQRYADILKARVAIKHKDFETAKSMFDGKLARYLTDTKESKKLSNGLKTVLNSTYGQTSAGYKNAFRDPRNKNNIVALRGALFMVNLRDELMAKGQTVIHIKTDSIKVVDPSNDIFNFVMEYGKRYGYTFEVEHKFERICLINQAVYIARLANDDPDSPGQWTATGAQFAQPYVFKTLFSKEPITFKDYTETKSVSGDGALYLDKNENLPEGEHDYQFVGRVGSFVPVVEGANGGLLLRYSKDKYSQATGTTGYRWLEAEYVKSMHLEDKIDISYHRHLVDEALEAISQFGDPDEFINGTIYPTVGQS